MLILKIKNTVVRIWPLSVLQRKINILNDELMLKIQDEIHLKLQIELLEKYNENLRQCNKELENKIEKKDELLKVLTINIEKEIMEKKDLETEIHNKTIELEKLKSEILSLQDENLKIKSMQSNFQSGKFWDNLYRNNGNSGTGSYNKLAKFKAEVVNEFLKEENIKTTIEFGCGDGNQLSLINYNYYVGVDVSSNIIDKNRDKFHDNDKRKFFYTLNERDKYIDDIYDLSISMDVIFHLIEDDVYAKYMEDLFKVSKKYVIIYSSNHEEYTRWPEFRHRNFLGYIQKNIKGWELDKFIPNKYPYFIGQEETTSTSDFYIFKKEE